MFSSDHYTLGASHRLSVCLSFNRHSSSIEWNCCHIDRHFVSPIKFNFIFLFLSFSLLFSSEYNSFKLMFVFVCNFQNVHTLVFIKLFFVCVVEIGKFLKTLLTIDRLDPTYNDHSFTFTHSFIQSLIHPCWLFVCKIHVFFIDCWPQLH